MSESTSGEKVESDPCIMVNRAASDQRLQQSLGSEPTPIWRDKLLLVLLGLQLAAAAPYLFPSLLNEGIGSDYEDSHVDVILGVITIVALTTCLRSRQAHREQRIFQWALTSCFCIWVTAKLAMSIASSEFTESVLGNAVFDGLLIFGMVMFLVAAEMQPDRPAGWTSKNGPFRTRLVGVLFATASLYTYFTLAPWLSESSEEDGWGRSLFLFIPFDAFLVLRFGWLHAFSTKRNWRTIYGALAIASALLLAVDTVEFMVQEEWLDWIGLEPLGLIWFLPYVVFTVVARLIARCPVANDEDCDGQASRLDSSNVEIVIAGLTLAILAIHFVGPLTGTLAESLAPVRNLIALSSLCVLGVLGLAQSISLGRNNRLLNRELEAMNAQLLQSQKMEAVGRLAGGMAHDFNNILMVVMGNEEMLRELVKHDEEASEHVHAIGDACTRANALTRQLLAFSKDHVQLPTSIDLAMVTRGLAGMMQQLIGAQVHLQINEKAEALWISANQTQIEQVLMNLCVNARDAMPDGGTLTVELDIANLGDAPVERSGDGIGTHAVLTVRDTGCGMSEPVLARIFDPFFSTKDRNLGTGLGLSTVYTIVKKSAGKISVASQPGRGATFQIHIPLTDVLPDVLPETEDATSVEPGDATILIIEDSAPLRHVACRVLRKHGYHVLSAESGQEAVHQAQDYQSEISVILADVVMPGMSGPEAVREVRKARPDVKILFMSGHTGDAIHEDAIAELGAGFIQKPFKLGRLLARIQSIVATQPSDS